MKSNFGSGSLHIRGVQGKGVGSNHKLGPCPVGVLYFGLTALFFIGVALCIMSIISLYVLIAGGICLIAFIVGCIVVCKLEKKSRTYGPNQDAKQSEANDYAKDGDISYPPPSQQVPGYTPGVDPSYPPQQVPGYPPSADSYPPQTQQQVDTAAAYNPYPDGIPPV